MVERDLGVEATELSNCLVACSRSREAQKEDGTVSRTFRCDDATGRPVSRASNYLRSRRRSAEMFSSARWGELIRETINSRSRLRLRKSTIDLRRTLARASSENVTRATFERIQCAPRFEAFERGLRSLFRGGEIQRRSTHEETRGAEERRTLGSAAGN